jgi:predicted  nucleic acid-binding Zn ribbon protein
VRNLNLKYEIRKDEREVMKIRLTEKAIDIKDDSVKNHYLIEILNENKREKNYKDFFLVKFLSLKNDDDKKICPSCKEKLTFLKILKRYYCFNCKKYITIS